MQEQSGVAEERNSLQKNESITQNERQRLGAKIGEEPTASKVTASENGIRVSAGEPTFSVAYQRSDGSRGVMPIQVDSSTNKVSVKDLVTVTRQSDGSFLISQNGNFSGKYSITIAGDTATFTTSSTRASSANLDGGRDRIVVSSAPKEFSKESAPQAYVSPTRLSSELAATFSRYGATIGAEGATCSNNTLWESYRQQCLQLVREYESKLVDRMRVLPSDQDSLRKIHAIQVKLNELFDSYEKDRAQIKDDGGPTSKSDVGQKAPVDALPEKAWTDRAKALFPKVSALYKEIEQERITSERYPSSSAVKTHERNNAFIERSGLFAEVYSQKEWHSDSKMMDTMLRHWEVLVQQYEKDKNTPAPLFSFDFNLSFVKEMSEKKGISSRYSGEMSPLEVRNQIISESQFASREKISSSQLASLLYLDAHFKEVAGEQLPDERSPTLNSADHQALVTKLAQDRLRNPDTLARDAISTLGFAEGSQEAFGIRYGLGVADLTQKQKSQLEFGARVASKRFQGPIRSVISDKYREAARGLERARDAGTQIREEVWKRADEGIAKAIDSFGAVKSKFVDSSPRSITESQLYEFQRHAQVLKTFDSSYLNTVGEVTGNTITPFIPAGFSQEIVRHYINNVTMTNPTVGIPKGIALRVEKRE